MSEFLTMPQKFNELQQIAMNSIGEEALKTIDVRFGTGQPEFKANHLLYHNGHHARMVGQGALRLTEMLDLPASVQKVAEITGFAHDIVQLNGRGVDEAESAAWLEEQIAQKEILPPAAAKLGSLAILGTEPLFGERDGLTVLVGQRAAELEYPSKISEQVAKSVAAADLSSLYIPEGPLLSHKLYHEIQGIDPREEPSPDKLLNFQRGQVTLLEGYSYPLEEADRAFATHRNEVTNYANRVLQQIERGEIHSWQQLIEQDLAFRDSLA